jgi:hypothetical protein
MVDVAQLVEPRIVIPVVAGSSPVVHPTSRRQLNGLRPLVRDNPVDAQRVVCGDLEIVGTAGEI